MPICSRVCFVCDAILGSSIPGPDDLNRAPSRAVVFYSRGNYGSQIFDIEIYEQYKNVRLEIYICDVCVSTKQKSAYTKITHPNDDRPDDHEYYPGLLTEEEMDTYLVLKK